MAQNYRELSRIPTAPTVFEHGLQKKMTKLVLSHLPLVPFPELILRRLQCWASRFPEVGQAGAPEAQLLFVMPGVPHGDTARPPWGAGSDAN
eukprot:1197726-Pyramimonas_sp.AAC.1